MHPFSEVEGGRRTLTFCDERDYYSGKLPLHFHSSTRRVKGGMSRPFELSRQSSDPIAQPEGPRAPYA